MERIRKITDRLWDIQVSILSWIGAFLSIIFIRCFLEQFVAHAASLTLYERTIEFIHNLYFFLIALLLVWIFVSFILKINPKRLSGLFAWSFFLVLLPPLIDMIRTGGQIYWSFYVIGSTSELWQQFITVFGNFPPGIVYFGTRITFILAIFFIAALAYAKSRKIFTALVGATGTYMIFFFMGSFPSIFSITYLRIIEKMDISSIKFFHIVQLVGAPKNIWSVMPPSLKYTFPYNLDLVYFPLLVLVSAVLFFMISREKFWAVIKNFRYPQIIYHAGLFFIGMGLGFLNYPQNFHINVFSIFSIFTLVLSIWLAWYASVVANDIYDLEIDRISNPGRPLPKEVFSQNDYSQFGAACFLLSLLGGISVGFEFLILLLVYQIIAWFYSAAPYRFKKYPGVASAVSAMASIMIVFMGFILLSDNQTIEHLSWRITFLLFFAYTLAIPIKDFKDIEGDGKYGIWTIPVLLGEKKGRLLVAVNIFVVYMISVFLLNEMRLFFWALIFAVISYLILMSKKINPKRLPWWFLGTVSIYSLILIKIVFVDHINSFLP